MKNTAIILSLILFSCSTKSNQNQKKYSEYPYQIRGFVTVEGKKCDAIWYTDTFYYRHDTVCYDNSDGSHVRIAPPYTIVNND